MSPEDFKFFLLSISRNISSIEDFNKIKDINSLLNLGYPTALHRVDAKTGELVQENILKNQFEINQLINQGKYKMCISYINSILNEKNDNKIKNHYKYKQAFCLYKLGDNLQSRSIMTDLQFEKPNDFDYLILLGSINKSLGHYKMAIENFLNANACYDLPYINYGKNNIGRSYFYIGKCFKNEGNLFLADKYAKNAIDYDPTLLEAYIFLIEITSSNNLEELREYFILVFSSFIRKGLNEELNGITTCAYIIAVGTLLSKKHNSIEFEILGFHIANKFKSNFDSMLKLAFLYSDWNEYKGELFDFSLEFRNVTFDWNSVINEKQYNIAQLTSKEHFLKAFYSYFLSSQDLYTNQEEYSLYLWVRDSSYYLYTLQEKAIVFVDPYLWEDSFDTNLLREIEEKKGIKLDCFKLRCLADLENIENGLSNNNALSVMYEKLGKNGVIYKLKIDKSWLVSNNIYINDVNYIEDINSIEYKFDSPEEILRKGLYSKNIRFNYEFEKRLTICSDSPESIVKIPFGTGVSITAIYMKLDLIEKTRLEIISLAEAEKIDLYDLKMHFNTVTFQKIIS